MSQDVGEKKKALVIAVSDYLNLPPHQQLPFCKNDGDSMYSTLSALGYEVVAKHIGTVTGDEFKDSVIDFFRDERLDTQDTTLFYFSGHGVSDKKGSGKYFGTTDINPDIPERKGIPYDFLIDQMEKSNSLKRIAILDCCYSGAAHPHFASKAVGDPERETEKLGREDLKVFEKSQGICVLASSRSNKLSYFIEDKKMSTYTHYIIEGLKGNSDSVDKQGFVTPSTLEEYVFSQMLKSDPKMQRPVNNLSTSGKIVLAQFKEYAKQKEIESYRDGYLTTSGVEKNEKLEELNWKAQDHYFHEDYENALSCLDKALEINPNYRMALLNKGFIYNSIGKYEKEIACYDEILKAGSSDVTALYRKGNTFACLKNYKEAIKWYDKTLKIDPGNVYAVTNKGNALYFLGKLDEALLCYYDALRDSKGGGIAFENSLKIRKFQNKE